MFNFVSCNKHKALAEENMSKCVNFRTSYLMIFISTRKQIMIEKKINIELLIHDIIKHFKILFISVLGCTAIFCLCLIWWN